MKSIRIVVVGFALLRALSARGAESDTVDPLWRGSIEQDIAAEEYRVSTGSGGLLGAPNRAHGLRVTFDAGGVRTQPRTEDAAAFEWGLEFVGFGRGEGIVRPQAAIPVANGNRVEYRRGNVVEWYVNDANGLEQGFTIAARPEGEGKLVVALAIQGTLTPMEQNGAIDFATSAGLVALRYDKLVAFDANGKTLSATMRPKDGVIQIEVDDRGATYPITIDPLTTNPAWTAESNQAIANFGVSVATAGDVNGDGCSDVIVGAHTFDNGEADEGRVFVYLGSAGGLAASPAWMAEGNQAGARFGSSVATAGDVNGDGYSDVVVGAYLFDNGEADEGGAFVFHGSADGLAATPAWTAESNQESANLGFSVATAGDVNGDGYSDVIVGVYQYDNGELNEGSALVYHGSAVGLTSNPAWTAEGNQAPACFGRSVATAGDVNGDGYSDVVVGANIFSNGESYEGRAYVYHGSAAGLAASAAWTAESDQASSDFGYSVATAGDVNGDGYSDIVVGAYVFDNGEFNEGRAYVYHGSVSGVASSAAWTAEGNQTWAFFGVSVATAGDVNGDGFSDVAVGAQLYDNGEADEGMAFVYLGSAVGVVATPAWTVESDQGTAVMGNSVATAGDVNGDGYSDVVVGSPFFDNGENNEGRAFLYLGSAAGVAASPGWTGDANATQSFGWSVASSGDVNGDGYSDVIVGAPDSSFFESHDGGAVSFLGSATGLATTETWAQGVDQANAGFGVSVASAGDVNGDGYSDVVVGAMDFDHGQIDEGRASLYVGWPGGLSSDPMWAAESNQSHSGFSYSVATAGDVNGDGYSDVVVGAPFYDNGETDEGRAFVYLGSTAGLAAGPSWTAESNQGDAYMGVSVATAGDVNGDGYSDVVVGAYTHTNGELYEGCAFVYLGSVSGLAASTAWKAEGNLASATLGFSLGAAGDVNGDGYCDVIIGAPSKVDGQLAIQGRALVFLGTAGGVAASPAWTAVGNQKFSEFGCSVASAGDVNGDGYSDVVIGAPTYSNDQMEEGRAFVYLSSAAGLAASPAWIAESVHGYAHFGRSVATAGDVNGDGYSDVIVGKYAWGNEDRAYVYYGNEGPGTLARPRQRLVDDSAPVAILGRTTTGSYRASLNLRSPFGRGDARLAVESKPLGTPFDGTGLTQSSLVDAGMSGADTAVTIGGLAANTKHHWRARVVHSKATTPFLPAGPWFSIPGNGAAETDIRAAVCGGTMASATPYGTGKAGTFGIPLLSSSIAPAKGSLSDVTISGGKPFASPVILFAGFAPAALPFDGGVLRVSPTFTISMPPLNGAGSLSLPVQHSTNPSTCGLHIYFQAIFADPGAAGFYHTAQTNGLDWVIGS